MPTKIEKDAVTGHVTTGHEWDGLQELNRPVPKWWIYVFWASVVWAVGFCVLYPSVPGITGYFHGIIGYYQRDAVDADVALVAQQRAGAMDKIKALSFADIRKDAQLLAVAETAGRITFAENCQPCHGAGGGGNPGFPALAAGNWLWGGKLEDIQQTVTFGIRSGLDDARNSQMPRFGADGILKPAEIQAVADYVATLYGLPATGADLTEGRRVFAENCAVCHGDTGQGNREVGGARLAARTHLHGDDRAAIVAQITNPRMGVMPNWNARLDLAKIKSVTLYVHSLGGGE
ncbi:MAG: cytochrome-c oxidase, cbb3-type subunit III [Acetobacteraceae bacterium]